MITGRQLGVAKLLSFVPNVLYCRLNTRLAWRQYHQKGHPHTLHRRKLLQVVTSSYEQVHQGGNTCRVCFTRAFGAPRLVNASMFLLNVDNMLVVQAYTGQH